MKRWSILLISLLLLFAFGKASATIEKEKPKKKNVPQAQVNKDSTEETGRISERPAPPEQKPDSDHSRGYDDFIDRNNDGIDDRVERKKETTEESTLPEKSKKSVKNTQRGDKEASRRTVSPDDSVKKLKNR